MSKIIIQCEKCDTEREVDEKMAGSTLTCSSCGETIRVPLPNVYSGSKIGGFTLEKQLGFGAMGEVWLANQQSMNRKVAIKLLSQEFTLDSQFVDRFLKEVHMSAKMDHPNIITAFDAGIDNDIYFLAISFVDGYDLDQELSKNKILSEKVALKIILEISSALCYAWNEFQMIHRDLKPSNIMIDKYGSAKLMDMGISKTLNEEAQLTMTGTVIGTPYYMSPEQGMGEHNLDCRSDIYSLGATLYHLVTGAFPFEATTAIGIISKHITEPLPPPQNTNPHLSDECSTLLEIMMGKNCKDRQQTWEEVIKDVNKVLKCEMPISKHRPNIGNSVIMRATDDELVDITEREKTSQPTENNQIENIVPIESQIVKRPKSSIKLIITLSAVTIIALTLAAFLVFDNKDNIRLEDSDSFYDDIINKNDELKLGTIKIKLDDDINSNHKAVPPSHASIKTLDRDEKRYKDMWNFATNFVKGNPNNYNIAISNFQELSRSAAGSKYKMMADVEINNLLKKQNRAITLVMTQLAKKSKLFIDKKDFNKAAEIYHSYRGLFEEETCDERVIIGDNLIKQSQDNEQLKLEQEQVDRENALNTASSIFDAIIKNNTKLANKQFSKINNNNLPSDIKKSIEQLLSMDKSIINSFKLDIGKEIIIIFKKGKIKGRIKKIKQNQIYVLFKKGRISIQKRFSLDQLSTKEIIKRANLNPSTVIILNSIYAAKNKKIEKAVKYAMKLNGELGMVFLDVISKNFNTEGILEIKEDEILNNPNINDDPIFEKKDNNNQKNHKNDDIYGELHNKLKAINSAYNREGRFCGERGRIEEADFFNVPGIDNKSLKIIAALPDLRILDLGGTNITNIAPLSKCKLEMLILATCHKLRDISSIKKIKTLKELSLFHTNIEDISSLKNLKLEMLDISRTNVKDIGALRNMPLHGLRMMNCSIKNFSVLKTLKKLQLLEPGHFWRMIPGKEHLFNPQKRRFNPRKK